MTKRQFVVLAFRIIAVYLLINFITNFSSFLVTLRGTAAIEGMSTIFAVGVIGLIIVTFLFVLWLLWKKSEWLMERILAVPVLQESADEESVTNEESPTNSEEHPIYDPYDSPLTTNSITQIVFVAIGLKAALDILPHLARQIDFLFLPYSNFTLLSTIELLIPDLLIFGVGLWLFLRPWQVQQWLSNFRDRHVHPENTQ